MPKTPITLVPFILLGIACISTAQTQPATRPFTISKETTLVDGPLNADGTINYVQVINDRLSKGVTQENNAAVLLCQALQSPNFRQLHQGTLDQLKIPEPGPKVPVLIDLTTFAKQQSEPEMTPADLEKLDASLTKLQSSPWSPTDAPMISDWLKDIQPSLALIEKACLRPRCYIPLVSKHTPPTWADALPPLSIYRVAANPLAARAMLHAGQGEMKECFADLKRIRILARFAVEGQTAINLLVGVAVENLALHAYEGLATSGKLNAEDLALLKKEIDSLPPMPGLSQVSSTELLFSLDDVMMFVRGDIQPLLLSVGMFDEKTPLATGDLKNMDWNALLIATQKEYANHDKIDALPFAERLKAYDPLIKAAVDEGVPGNWLYDSDQKTGIKPMEDFLRRRHNETRADYASRIAHWRIAGLPKLDKRVNMLLERDSLERNLALLAASLAEYHLANHTYPDDLKQLGQPVLQDPLSGKDIIYRRDGAGYILYSVGLNQKDDDGKEDDMPIKADK